MGDTVGRRGSVTGRGSDGITLGEGPGGDDSGCLCSVGVTGLKGTAVVVSWHEPVAAHLVVDVGAEHLGSGIGALAAAEAV